MGLPDARVPARRAAGAALDRGPGPGLVVVCFLAFLLRTLLERRLFEEGEIKASFTEVLDALNQIHAVDLAIKEIPLKLVTEPPDLARKAFQALGIRPPARLQKLA